METKKILIVEDEKHLARVVELELKHEGFLVKVEHDGLGGLRSAASFEPDLILLDLMLPGLNGMEVCRRVREYSAVPVIMLTARDETADKVNGLDLGANDYVTKPFVMAELLARIRAALRSGDPAIDAVKILKAGALVMDLSRHVVTFEDTPVGLTKREFDLLEYLMRNKGLLLSREQILDNVWGIDYTGDANVVDVYILYLRSKLGRGRGDTLIRTVRGFGYRMERDTPDV